MKKLYKDFTAKTLATLIDKGLLDSDNYLLTPHRLIVPIEKADAVYDYLFTNGYISTAEDSSEYSAMFINE